MLNTEDVALEVRMKLKKLIGITTMALSVMVLLPVRLNAEQHGGRRNQRRYKFVDVGTFGGPQSYINAAFAAEGNVAAPAPTSAMICCAEFTPRPGISAKWTTASWCRLSRLGMVTEPSGQRPASLQAKERKEASFGD
jgi:hypothetical protein